MSERKKTLQNEQAALQKRISKIAVHRKMAEMRLGKVNSRLCAARNSRAGDLAAAALSKSMDARVNELREEFSELETLAEELPLMIAGLKSMEQDLGYTIGDIGNELGSIRREEKLAAELAEFEAFKSANFQGDWEHLKRISPLSALDFDRVRMRYEAVHG